MFCKNIARLAVAREHHLAVARFQSTCSGSRWSQIHGSWFSPDKVLQNALGKIFPSFQFLVKPAAAAAAMDVTAIDAATVVDKDQ